MLVTLVAVDRPCSKGEAWRVIDKRESVGFSQKCGPWLLVVPAGRPPEDMAARWVHGLLDSKFKVIPGTPS